MDGMVMVLSIALVGRYDIDTTNKNFMNVLMHFSSLTLLSRFCKKHELPFIFIPTSPFQTFLL